MSTYMRKVVSVETPTVVREHVRKTKVTEYVRGGSVMVEIVERITAKRPVAILECGWHVPATIRRRHREREITVSRQQIESAEFEYLKGEYERTTQDQRQRAYRQEKRNGGPA